MPSPSTNHIEDKESIVVRPAVSILGQPSAEQDKGGYGSALLAKFASREFDSWTALEHLAASTHEGVRDYLVNRMYEMMPEDLDLFLPQLCALLVTWDRSRGALERFVLDKCSTSLHCAMKLVWMLQAMTPYCADQDSRERCADLAKNCEIVVVNFGRPKFLERIPAFPPQIDCHDIDAEEDDENQSQDEAKLSELALERLPHYRTPSAADLESRQHLALERRMDMLFGRNEALTKQLERLSGRLKRMYSRKQLSPKRTPLSSPHLLMPSSSEPNFNVRSSVSESKSGSIALSVSPASPASSPLCRSPPRGLNLELFLGKQQRSEFFTAQLHLIAELEEISLDLLRYARDQRRLRLQRLLTLLNERICRGLYFPNCDATENHYTILRVLPEEANPLSSHLKVPFLMYFEVLVSGDTKCSSSNVHTFYHVERDSARTYLLELMERCKHSSSSRSPPRHYRRAWASTIGKPFGELMEERKDRLRKSSPFGRLDAWDLRAIIFKSGDDCRQEQLAMQMIKHIDYVFSQAKLPLKLRPFEILVTSPTSGMIEVIPNAKSIDSLKKAVPSFTSLLWFFEHYFGPRGSEPFKEAQKNFVESMAAYSLVCYLLQIKDRHNGNIMMDNSGAIIHIDFGFFLSNSPGGNINFESAPFKLTQEYIEVMEGEDSEAFGYFRLLMIRGFLELRKHAHHIVLLAEVLLRGPSMNCFYMREQSIVDLRTRFHSTSNEQQCVEFVYSLITQSINNWRSVQYDTYQRITNGIL